jgi:cell division ATPase FtsA
MSWHDLNEGVEYEIEDVISLLEQRISTGIVDNVDEKKECIEKLKAKIGSSAVFQPKSVGWGRSPFNPNSWVNKEGEPFFPEN